MPNPRGHDNQLTWIERSKSFICGLDGGKNYAHSKIGELAF